MLVVGMGVASGGGAMDSITLQPERNTTRPERHIKMILLIATSTLQSEWDRRILLGFSKIDGP
jgi:hypothetical protein